MNTTGVRLLAIFAVLAVVSGCAAAPPDEQGIISSSELDAMISIEVRPIEPSPDLVAAYAD